MGSVYLICRKVADGKSAVATSYQQNAACQDMGLLAEAVVWLGQ